MPQDDPYAKYQAPAASSGGGDPYAQYQAPAAAAKPAVNNTPAPKQPSAGRVLIEPVSKTDKDYLSYTGLPGVVGATKHGITNIAKSTYEAGKQAVGGVYETGKDIAQNPDRPLVIPDKEGKYKGQPTIYEKYVQPAVHDIGQRFEQIPAGIRELGKEPEPVMSYVRNAEPTVDAAAGQAIIAAATEAAPKVAPPIIRGAGRVLKNPVVSSLAAPAITAGTSAVLGGTAPLDIATAGTSLAVGEHMGIPKMIESAGNKMSEFGLTDDQLLTKHIGEQMKVLDKNVSKAQSVVDKWKKGGTGYVPPDATEALEKAEQERQDFIRHATAPAKPSIAEPTPAAEPAKPTIAEPAQGKPGALKKIPVSESAKPVIGTPQSLAEGGKVSIGEVATPETAPEYKRVGIRGESKASRAMQEMGAKGGESEASLGQFAKVNGTRIENAIAKAEGETYGSMRSVRDEIHSISGKNGDLGRTAEALKVEIKDLDPTLSKNRQELFNRMLDAGHSPEEIAKAYRSVKK